MKQRRRTRAHHPRRRKPVIEPVETPESSHTTAAANTGGGPGLSGGDIDADWRRADAVGEEAVGGSAPTPDQDVVDEIGRALGVEQEADSVVVTSEEILRRRDRFRWHLECEAERREREQEERTGSQP